MSDELMELDRRVAERIGCEPRLHWAIMERHESGAVFRTGAFDDEQSAKRYADRKTNFPLASEGKTTLSVEQVATYRLYATDLSLAWSAAEQFIDQQGGGRISLGLVTKRGYSVTLVLDSGKRLEGTGESPAVAICRAVVGS